MNTFTEWIQSLGVEFEKMREDLWYFPNKNLLLQFPGNKEEKKGIRIWEKQWRFQKDIVQSRIKLRLGLLPTLPGRVCKIRRIDKHTADHFLDLHHLQGTTTSKLKYGLYLPQTYLRLWKGEEVDEVLVGVMTFSGARNFRDGSKSCELIRFCTHKDVQVIGAFTKLFAYFRIEKEPGSVMTYVDLEWWNQKIYPQFEIDSQLDPIPFGISDDGRWNGNGKDYENKGSLKLIWKS